MPTVWARESGRVGFFVPFFWKKIVLELMYFFQYGWKYIGRTLDKLY